MKHEELIQIPRIISDFFRKRSFPILVVEINKQTKTTK